MEKYVMILAAGKGTRMKSSLPKVLHEAVYHPILAYVIEAAKGVDAAEICTVVGHGADAVRAAFDGETSFVLQREQKGTGHAVREGLSAFSGHRDGTMLVLCGDTPLLRAETLKKLCDYHEQSGAAVTVMTASLDDPFGYGRIIRDREGGLLKIVEQRDADEEEKAVCEINSGVYCFDLTFLRDAVTKLESDNDQGELYLTDTIAIANGEGRKAAAFQIDDYEEVSGINDRVQLAAAAKVLRRRKAEALMRAGVTVVDPDSTIIDPFAEIGADTIIEPFSIIKGRTVIGENCRIGPNAELTDSVIGNDVKFWRSVAVEATVADGGNIGPFAYLRPKTELKNNVKVGDFVEVKNSVIGEGTKMPHLTYVGDSDVGSGCNIACGTITCNYDGFLKTRSKIGDRVFVGCNVNLVSPVHIDNDVYIAAGSTITESVPGGSLAIARERQVNKEGWAEKFRAMHMKDEK